MIEKLNLSKRSLLRAIDMKTRALITAVAGLVLISSGTVLAGDAARVTAVVPPMKKDSAHIIPAPNSKEAMPQHLQPLSPKPNLPVDAGRQHSAATIGGPAGTSPHRDGIVSGTEIKRHP